MLHLSHHRRRIALGQYLLRCQYDTLGRSVHLKASLVAATALAPVKLGAGVSNLASKAVAPQMGCSVGEDATAHAAAKRNQNEVFHAVRHTISVFTKGTDVGVVSQCHCQSHAVTHHGGHRHHTLPRQIGSVLDTPRHEVGTRTADADRTDALVSAVILYKINDNLAEQ